MLLFSHISGVFEKALSHYRVSAPELKEERAMLLDEWLKMEKDFGELGDVGLVQSKMPKKLKRRRPLMTDDGPAGYVNNLLLSNLCHCYIYVMF